MFMKAIDRSNRETLLEFLKLPDDIRKYDINKQYYILHEKIESLEKSFFIDDFIIIHSDYVSNTNQDIAWQSVLKNFQIKDYLNAYFDIINYIEENKEIRNIYEIEYSEHNQAKSAYGIHSVRQCLRSFDKHDDGECYLDYSEDYADDVQDRPSALFFQYFPEFHGWCQFILS